VIVRLLDHAMQNRKRNEWMWPPADQWITVWGFGIAAIIAILTGQLLSFFSRLTGTRWVWCYTIALVIAGFGVSLIFFAKLPALPSATMADFWQSSIARAAAFLLPLGLPLRCVRYRTACVFTIFETMKHRAEHALQRPTASEHFATYPATPKLS
jgi:hypothetical protein